MTTTKISLSGNQKPQLQRTDSLQKYYADIRPYKPLSWEELKDLFQLYRQGDKKEREAAYNKICRHNLRLVITVAREYCGSTDNLNDLIQEGNFGLMKAIEKFDTERNVAFATYAVYWIRRYINLFKINHTSIIAQTNRHTTVNALTSIRNQLYQSLERTPTNEEVLIEYNEKTDRPLKGIEDVVNVKYMYIDDADSKDDDGHAGRKEYNDYQQTSAVFNECETVAEKEYNKTLCSVLLDGLTIREKQVIRLAYGLDDGIEHTIHSVGLHLGITSQRASQLYAAAIKKMKKKRDSLQYTYS